MASPKIAEGGLENAGPKADVCRRGGLGTPPAQVHCRHPGNVRPCPPTLVATLVAAYFRHHAPPPASPRAPEQEDYRDLRSVSEVTTSVQLNLARGAC